MEILYLSLMTSCISITISKSKIFTNLRKTIKINWLNNLIRCTFCLSFWIVLIEVIIWKPKVIESPLLILTYMASLLVIVAISAPISGIIYHSFRWMDN